MSRARSHGEEAVVTANVLRERFRSAPPALSGGQKRGAALGSPKLHLARQSAAVAVKAQANQHAANVLPIIKEAQRAGANTRAVAEAPNARGIATARWCLARDEREEHAGSWRSAVRVTGAFR